MNPSYRSSAGSGRCLMIGPGELTMKLNLLFIVMDLLTLLAYPIVFVHGRLFRYFKSKARIHPPMFLLTVPVAPER